MFQHLGIDKKKLIEWFNMSERTVINTLHLSVLSSSRNAFKVKELQIWWKHNVGEKGWMQSWARK